jgi:hypothetical protein
MERKSSDLERSRDGVMNVRIFPQGFRSPAAALSKVIEDALDPMKQPGKVRRLADMTSGEKAALERQYGVPIDPTTNERLVRIDYAIVEKRGLSYRIACRTNAHRRWVSRKLVTIDGSGPSSGLLVPRWYAVRLGLLPDPRFRSKAHVA